jgi:lipoprotein-releasing system permease protein
MVAFRPSRPLGAVVYRLFLALRYLRSRLVNLISIGGVMFGVAVLLVVVAIMDGFQDRVRTSVRGSLSHIIMTPTVSAEDLPALPDLEADLKQQPHVVAAAPMSSLPVFYEYETRRVSAVSYDGVALHQMEAMGVDWEREQGVTELGAYLMAAADPTRPFFHPVAAEKEKYTVLVSFTFAQNFRLGQFDKETGEAVRPFGALYDEFGAPLSIEDQPEAVAEACKHIVGSQIKILWGMAAKGPGGQREIKSEDRNMIISGIYNGPDAVEANRHLYMDIDQVRRMGRMAHAYLQVRVKLDDFENAPDVKVALAGRFGESFEVETWEDQKKDFLQAVNSEKVLLVIVLSFIIMLGGFVILATLTLTVVEKTKDIGVIAALGAPRRGVLAIFLFNGLIIGIIGSILGLGLGAWFTANVDAVRAGIEEVTGRDVFPQGIYHFSKIPTVWHWPTVFVIMAGAIGVAFLAGLLPALRAARLDPVAALRYE